jgi:hypothetical protein
MIDDASLQDSVVSDESRQKMTLNNMWPMSEPDFGNSSQYSFTFQ